jgi:hypothetical protein
VSEDWVKSASRPVTPTEIDTSVPNPARVWDAMNRGHDNFDADRKVAQHLVAAAPVLEQAGAAGWAFRHRVVSYLAGEARIRQFIDISMGMRGADSSCTHAVARAPAPGCRVVYVVNDPVVLSHARAMLRSPGEGTISYVDADLNDVESFLPGVGETLDLAEPVGVIMPDSLNFTADASAVVAGLVAAVTSGSYLAVIVSAPDERLAVAIRRWNRMYPVQAYQRDASEVASWFGGCDLLEPGVVQIHRWRPEPDEPDYPAGLPLLGAVARKR